MELRDALSQIAEIRSRVAAAERFRGYRAVPVALTGLLAVLVAAVQPLLVPAPADQVSRYLWLWLCAAALAATVAGSGIWLRHRRTTNPLAKQLTWLAVGQFAPCLLAGGLTTAVILRNAPEHAPLLPGLWQVFFSLGVFASCRLLPPAISAVGGGLPARRGRQPRPRRRPVRPQPVGDGPAVRPRPTVHRRPLVLEPGTDPAMTPPATPAATIPPAAGGLDRVLHEPSRLGVLTSLLARREGLSFTDLKRACRLTDGNLSRHLSTLEENGLVEQIKTTAGRRPLTTARLTAAGRRRFLEYLEQLEGIVTAALSTAEAAPEAGMGLNPA